MCFLNVQQCLRKIYILQTQFIQKQICDVDPGETQAVVTFSGSYNVVLPLQVAITW